MHASTLLILFSLRCLAFDQPTPYTAAAAPCAYATATAQYGRFTCIPLSYFMTQPQTYYKPRQLFPSLLLLLCVIVIVIVIVISKLLKRYSQAKRTRAPAYSRALRRIKGGFPKGGQEKLRSEFQSTRRGQSSC